MKPSDQVINVFGQYNCAQTIFSLFASELGISHDVALKIASGFGGGMNRGETCGAVTGAYMVIGLKSGHSTDSAEDKAHTRELIEKFNSKFLSEHSSLKCKELLGLNISEPGQRDIARSRGLYESHCPLYLKTAAKILEEHF